MFQKIVVIGLGNLGSHLVKQLIKVNLTPKQIFTRKTIGRFEGIMPCHDLKDIIRDADLYILAVSDDAILEVLNSITISNPDTTIVHCSGATPIEKLKGFAKNYGVFWPIQTFSKNEKTDFLKVPICINANNMETKKSLRTFGEKITNKVYFINEKDRPQLHLTAVLVNNFVNHLYKLADDLLQTKNLTLDILKPLMLETAKKAQYNAPYEIQSGPAIRNDLGSIETHLKELEDHQDLKDIYLLLSNSINPNLKLK